MDLHINTLTCYGPSLDAFMMVLMRLFVHEAQKRGVEWGCMVRITGAEPRGPASSHSQISEQVCVCWASCTFMDLHSSDMVNVVRVGVLSELFIFKPPSPAYVMRQVPQLQLRALLNTTSELSPIRNPSPSISTGPDNLVWCVTIAPASSNSPIESPQQRADLSL